MPKPTPQEALVYLMVIVSASDRDMRDEELARIGAIIRTLPVFDDFDHAHTLAVAQECQRLLHEEAGFEGVLDMIADVLEPPLRETAYVLAVDIAAADHSLRMEEARMLDIVRERFGIDAVISETIDRAAAIRHRTLADQ